MPQGIYQERAWEISQQFAALEYVDAVVLGGSSSTAENDSLSDIDLYVYASRDIDLEFRTKQANTFGSNAIIDHRFWEAGDYWLDNKTNCAVDIMYRSLSWMKQSMDQVLHQYKASMGFSTCFWYNVKNSQVLFDRNTSFKSFQSQYDIPYPQELKKAIIAKNYPVLQEFPFSYLHQIYIAMKRKDAVSLNHRTTQYFSSFFDVLFAVNELAHPGEKRMLSYASRECKHQTPHMAHHISRIFKMQDVNNENYYTELRQLGDNLRDLLKRLDLSI